MSSDLHATHQIVSLLERSKTVTDRILDQMPGIFAAVDAEGVILRSNVEAAQVLGVPHEEMIHRPFSDLFQPLTWRNFQESFKMVVSDQRKDIEFELMLDGIPEPRSYFWQIQHLDIRGADGVSRNLYSVLGRDITDIKKALSKVAVLGKNLELAKAVQNLILPRTDFFESPNIKLAAYYEAAEVAGGDLWWFDVHNPNRAIVMMGDVTGHGVGSAMVTSLVCGGIVTMQRIERTTGPQLSVDQLFDTVNAALLRLDGNPYWLTLFSVEIDYQKRVFEWTTAAAPPIYLLKKSGVLEQYVEQSNHLGSPDIVLGKGRVSYERGDRLLLFTDGVTDLENYEGRTIGYRNIEKCLKSTHGKDIRTAKKMFEETMTAWRNGAPLVDDAAFVLLDL